MKRRDRLVGGMSPSPGTACRRPAKGEIMPAGALVLAEASRSLASGEGSHKAAPLGEIPVGVFKQRVAELERERELLNSIANYAPSLLCLIDDDGRVRPFATNKAFERTLGYEPHETGGPASGIATCRTVSARSRAIASSRRFAARRRPTAKGDGCSATGRRSRSPGPARRCRRSRPARLSPDHRHRHHRAKAPRRGGASFARTDRRRRGRRAQATGAQSS